MAHFPISRLGGTAAIVLAVLVALCSRSTVVLAQSQAPSAKSAATLQPHRHPVRHKGAKAALQTPPAEEIKPAEPVQPPAPDWPANAQAAPAAVEWNGRDLSIAATNSSLQQILNDVATATGVKVEGLGTDQRIFGSYGPAAARDVLGQLLEGSGYNVLMIGDAGEGTPRQLVLSSKTGGATSRAPGQIANAQQDSNDEAPEDPEPPEQVPQNMHRPNGNFPQQPFGQGRTPQEMMQQMQQRQQQLQNSQQLQNGQQPPPPPQE